MSLEDYYCPSLSDALALFPPVVGWYLLEDPMDRLMYGRVTQVLYTLMANLASIIISVNQKFIKILLSFVGELQHVYTGLPFTMAVCAMTYHPTEHMLVISTFASHQPLIVYTHISRGVESSNTQSVAMGNESDSIGKETGIMKQDSMILHLNQRLREVTKTLNRTTGLTAARRKKIRKK